MAASQTIAPVKTRKDSKPHADTPLTSVNVIKSKPQINIPSLPSERQGVVKKTHSQEQDFTKS